jgi:hypothetical protein
VLEKYRSCQLPPLVYSVPLVHLAKGVPELMAPLHLYLYDPNTTWSIRLVFIFGIEFLRKLSLITMFLRVHHLSL